MNPKKMLLLLILLTGLAGCREEAFMNYKNLRITSLTADKEGCSFGDKVTLTAEASGPPENSLTYLWYSTEGTLLTKNESQVIWKAPDGKTLATILVMVTDGNTGKTAQETITIEVKPNILSVSPDEGLTVDTEGNVTAKNNLTVKGGLIVEDEAYIGNLHLFTASQYRELWREKGGGPFIADATQDVPARAKGAILKVVLTAHSVGSGSLIVSDREGKFNDTIDYWLQNGFSNYSDHWLGGTIFAPFIIGTKTFKYKTDSHASGLTDDRLRSWASIIGWF